MGAVSIDVHKRERDYKNLTLSDENVVRWLIIYRSKVDATYGATMNSNLAQAGDTFDFNQELIVLYASLDVLIEKINVKQRDKDFLRLIFEGNSITDIIEMYGYPRKTAYRTLDRIICKIVEANNDDWKKSIDKFIEG